MNALIWAAARGKEWGRRRFHGGYSCNKDMSTERYTCEQMIKAFEGTWGIVTDVARKLRCSRLTVYRYMKRHPTIQQAFDDERSKIVDMAEHQFVSKIREGQDWAVKWGLATLGKDRGYFEKRQQDVNVDGRMVIELTWPEDAED